MLNRIREMASLDGIANEIDGEEFLIGSDHVLPAEMIRLLSGKPQAIQAGANLGKTGLILDEHELALSY